MKKIIFSLAIVSLITLAACSDEESLPTIAYSGCATCEVEGVAPDYIPEDYEICVAKETLNSESDTLEIEVVYVNGRSTGIAPERYFDLFCDNTYGEATTPEPGEGEEPGGGTNGPQNCVSCAAFNDVNTGTAIPAREICQGENGNAYIGDVDQGLSYANFVTAMNLVTQCE